MMCEKEKSRLPWLSATIGGTYLLWIAYYIAGSGGIVWPGISVFVIVPHLLCTVLAVACTVVGILNQQSRASLYGIISYGMAAVLFPPFHVFLILPAVFMAVWHFKRTPELAE